jgi:tRNA(Ile)-lysidine synthase
MPPGATLLVAVSGGVDSTALLVGLVRVAPEFGLELRAAHLHHGLRGADADADLAFVRRMCARLGVPLDAARCDARALMKRRGLAGENGLRILRRRFLRAAARRSNVAAIATAHTADDQLETVLMRLLRGAGLRGMGGMRERQGIWLKPLLDATRLEVETDLRRARIEWREDASNHDPAWTRNRIRHHAIPELLEALEPARTGTAPARAAGGDAPAARVVAEPDRSPARAALARRVAFAAREVRDAERALRAWLATSRPALCRIQDGIATLETGRLRAFPIAARRMALRAAFARVAPPGVGLTRRHVAALCSLSGATRTQGRVDLPAGVRAVRQRHAIRLIAGRAGAATREPIHGLRPRAFGGRPAGASRAWGEP